MSHHRTVVAGLAVLAAALVTAGCSAAASGDSSPPAVTSTPTLLATSGLTLPVEEYLFTDQQMAELTNAHNRLAANCMRRFGFSYTAPESPSISDNGTAANLPRRYGVVDATQVSTLGYHPPRATAGKPNEPLMDATTLLVLTGDQGAMSTQDIAVKSSSGKSYGGKQIPDHGCSGDAYRTLLAGGGSAGNPELSDQIDGDSLARSMSDARVKQAFGAWSACMQTKGYHYATPFDPMNDRQFATATPSAREIATAVADVACKKQHNVIGVWYSVDAAYQNVAIQQDIQQLDQIRTQMRDELKVAATVSG